MGVKKVLDQALAYGPGPRGLGLVLDQARDCLVHVVHGNRRAWSEPRRQGVGAGRTYGFGSAAELPPPAIVKSESVVSVRRVVYDTDPAGECLFGKSCTIGLVESM